MSKPYIKILNKTDQNKCNCVLWVRDRIKSLPFGLWTIDDKIKIINKKKPKKNYVAIIETGQKWGHVAIVKKVGSNHITIQEANWKTCTVTERHYTPKDLKILGYFKG
ncbi:MAG: CHAP domain-containing protein [Candidatus Moraniibacteriota bacterium]